MQSECHARLVRSIAALFLPLSAIPAHQAQAQAQEMPVRRTTLRYDEDWSVLRDADRASLPRWEKIKYQPLTSDDAVWVSSGVELRVRNESYRNGGWGDANEPGDDPVFARIIPHVDLHAGPLRMFVQGIAGVPLTMDAEPGPADKTGADLAQGFAEMTVPLGTAEITFRGGRELISLGSERLVGTRYGTNIPQPFDGVHVIGEFDGLRTQIFDLQPVDIGPHNFDDRTSRARGLRGVYLTYKSKDLGLDAYILAFRNQNARFQQQASEERRQTYGLRFFGATDRLSWNWEAMLQTGTFGRSRIAAWSLGTETSYAVSLVTFRLRANYISGDRDANDSRLQTFNPLFPKGRYFGELSPVGPYNLVNVQQSIAFDIRPDLRLSIAAEGYWRARVADGVYGVPGNLLRPALGSTARSIGHKEELLLEWQPAPILSLSTSYSIFSAGRFIRETGSARPIHMLALEATFRM